MVSTKKKKSVSKGKKVSKSNGGFSNRNILIGVAVVVILLVAGYYIGGYGVTGNVVSEDEISFDEAFESIVDDAVSLFESAFAFFKVSEVAAIVSPGENDWYDFIITATDHSACLEWDGDTTNGYSTDGYSCGFENDLDYGGTGYCEAGECKLVGLGSCGSELNFDPDTSYVGDEYDYVPTGYLCSIIIDGADKIGSCDESGNCVDKNYCKADEGYYDSIGCVPDADDPWEFFCSVDEFINCDIDPDNCGNEGSDGVPDNRGMSCDWNSDGDTGGTKTCLLKGGNNICGYVDGPDCNLKDSDGNHLFGSTNSLCEMTVEGEQYIGICNWDNNGEGMICDLTGDGQCLAVYSIDDVDKKIHDGCDLFNPVCVLDDSGTPGDTSDDFNSCVQCTNDDDCGGGEHIVCNDDDPNYGYCELAGFSTSCPGSVVTSSTSSVKAAALTISGPEFALNILKKLTSLNLKMAKVGNKAAADAMSKPKLEAVIGDIKSRVDDLTCDFVDLHKRSDIPGGTLKTLEDINFDQSVYDALNKEVFLPALKKKGLPDPLNVIIFAPASAAAAAEAVIWPVNIYLYSVGALTYWDFAQRFELFASLDKLNEAVDDCNSGLHQSSFKELCETYYPSSVLVTFPITTVYDCYSSGVLKFELLLTDVNDDGIPGNSDDDYYYYQPPIFDTYFHTELSMITKKYSSCFQLSNDYDAIKAKIIATTTTDIVPK